MNSSHEKGQRLNGSPETLMLNGKKRESHREERKKRFDSKQLI